MKYTLFFSECSEKDLAQVGRKAQGIAELFRKGFKVPPGFILSRNVFDLIASEKVVKAVSLELSRCPIQNIEHCKEKLSEVMTSFEFPEEVADEVIEAYLSLSVDLSMSAASLLETKEVFVAVRGSIISENDFPMIHQKTTLNIRGKDRLFKAVLEDYAQTLSEAIIESRKKGNIKDFSMAIVVQKMINSERAGIAVINADNSEEIIVKACFGLGEGMKSDSILPDTYKISKEDCAVISRDIGDKKYEFVRDIESYETVKQDLYDNSRKEVLYDDEAVDIAKTLKKVNSAFGKSLQIEWALKGKNLYILQAKESEIGHSERVEMEVFEETKPPEVIDIIDINDDLKALDEIEEIEKKEPKLETSVEPKNIADEDIFINIMDENQDNAQINATSKDKKTYDVLTEQALIAAGNTIVACHKAVEEKLRNKLGKYTKKLPDNLLQILDELRKYEKVEDENEFKSLNNIKDDYLTKKKYPGSEEVGMAVRCAMKQ